MEKKGTTKRKAIKAKANKKALPLRRKTKSPEIKSLKKVALNNPPPVNSTANAKTTLNSRGNEPRSRADLFMNGCLWQIIISVTLGILYFLFLLVNNDLGPCILGC